MPKKKSEEKPKTKSKTKKTGKGMPSHLEGKAVLFSADNQPSPEAKAEGRRKALAKRQVIDVLKETFLNETVPLNVGGKIEQITCLEAGILKIVRTYINKPDDMIKVLSLINNFERNHKMDNFRIREAEEKKGNYETEFNDSFLQALNAQAGEVWDDAEPEKPSEDVET